MEPSIPTGSWQETDPITLEPFRVPFVASDGKTYELESLLEWVEKDWKHSSPLTRVPLRPLAFFDEQTALHLGLPTPKDTTVPLYRGDVVNLELDAPVTVVQVKVVLSIASCIDCEWLAMLFDAKGLMKRRVVLEAFLEPGDAQSNGETAKPKVIGYPVADTVRAQLESFCRAFLLDAMWAKCDQVASCGLLVDGQYVCTVEELLNDPAAHAAYDVAMGAK